MMSQLIRPVSSILLVTFLLTWCAVGQAELTAEHRRELSRLRSSLGRVGTLIRRKDYEKAEEDIDEAAEKLKAVMEAAGVDEQEKSVGAIQKLIESRREALEAAKSNSPTGGKSGGISFSKQVAPILQAKCARCHGDRASGGLKLDSFASMKKGGSSGPLLFVGRPDRSLLMARLTRTVGNKRQMPQGGAPLSRDELQIVSGWIAQGAKFDGADESTMLADLGKPAPPNVTVVIPKPTGNETVSFVDDIAPTLVNLCLRCHNDNQKNGGLSLATFESMMRGGESGRVVIPGNLEGSRLWQLVGGGEQPRMPQGQARITKTFYRNLMKWFEEGNTYDGENPKTTLRELVPTDEEKRMQELAAMTPEEFTAMRREQGQTMYKRVVPRGGSKLIEGDEVIVYGDVSDDRLQQVGTWAGTFSDELRKQFGIKETPIWKGKLLIFVFKDRFGYSEFCQVIESRRIPPGVTGHSKVTANTHEEAYVVVQDVGDETTSETVNLNGNLVDHMVGAFLQRRTAALPAWVVRGTGLALSAKANANDTYHSALRQTALAELKDVARPEDIFANGTFSPTGVSAVGFTLVDYMLKTQGGAKFGRFVGELERGQSVAAALRSVYRVDPKQLAISYAARLQKGR